MGEKFNESYIGQKNNLLTVIDIKPNKDNKNWFLCRCDCGNIKLIKPTYWERGTVKSCGCYSKSLKLEHNGDLDRLRRIYNGMKIRCYNPKFKKYSYYGGRGISICQEWLEDRQAFIDWALSHGYRADLTIDRINNDGNYEPSNCRWADRSTQNKNQRERDKNCYRTLGYKGKMYSFKELCESYGRSPSLVRYRVRTMGMSLEKALTLPRYATVRKGGN